MNFNELITKPTDVVEKKFIISTICGDPGTGKTTLSQTCKNPVTLDFDGRVANALLRKDFMSSEKLNWTVLRENMNGLLDFLSNYDTIIIDTADAMIDAISAHLLSIKDYKNKLRFYGDLKDEGINFINQLNKIQKDIVFITHLKDARGRGDAERKKPDIAGGTGDFIIKKSDLIGYILVKSYKDIAKRFIEFEPKEDTFSKSPGNIGTLEIPNNPAPDSLFLYDVIETAKENIKKISSQSQEINNEFIKINSQLDKISKVDALTDFFNNIYMPTEDITLKTMIKDALKKKARSLGFEYSKETGGFVDANKPEPKAEPQPKLKAEPESTPEPAETVESVAEKVKEKRTRKTRKTAGTAKTSKATEDDKKVTIAFWKDKIDLTVEEYYKEDAENVKKQKANPDQEIDDIYIDDYFEKLLKEIESAKLLKDLEITEDVKTLLFDKAAGENLKYINDIGFVEKDSK